MDVLRGWKVCVGTLWSLFCLEYVFLVSNVGDMEGEEWLKF